MPNPGDHVTQVGARGATGPVGLTGPAWQGDPPSDGNTYGRYNAGWLPVLPLTGGTVTAGISFGTNIASGPSDTSKHIRIIGTGGVCITGSTLNYYSGTSVPWRGSTNSIANTFAFGYWGGSIYGMLAFDGASSAPTTYLQEGRSTGDFSWTGASGYYYFQNSTNQGQMYGAANGCYLTQDFWCTDVGIRPYTSTYTNGCNWRWDGTWMYARIDNSVEWAVAVQCDERMKQDIAPSDFDALAAIKKVRLYQFRWKDHRLIGRPKSTTTNPTIPIGLIAQRLKEDFPEAVKSGGVFKRAVTMWTTDGYTMLAALCRAVQQLDERLQTLRGSHA